MVRWLLLHGLFGAMGAFIPIGWALLVLAGQLALNALWIWLYFGWHEGGLAFADFLIVWGLF